MVGLTRFMAGALGVKGITVKCIAPGITMSDATRQTMGRGAPGETAADVIRARLSAAYTADAPPSFQPPGLT